MCVPKTSHVGEALSKRFAEAEPAAHIEQRIYEGFPSDDDAALMEKFHIEPWAGRLSFVEKFKDDRVVEFSRRLIYAEQPDLLLEADAAKMKDWAANRTLTEDDVPWITVSKALAEIEALKEEAEEGERELLAEIQVYIEQLSEKFG